MQTTIGAGDFKAKCLEPLDEVAATTELLTITKHGEPVSKLVPVPGAVDLFGGLKGSMLAQDDIGSLVDIEWAADQP